MRRLGPAPAHSTAIETPSLDFTIVTELSAANPASAAKKTQSPAMQALTRHSRKFPCFIRRGFQPLISFQPLQRVPRYRFLHRSSVHLAAYSLCSAVDSAADLPLLSGRFQLAVAFGVDLLLTTRRHILRRDAAKGMRESSARRHRLSSASARRRHPIHAVAAKASLGFLFPNVYPQYGAARAIGDEQTTRRLV